MEDIKKAIQSRLHEFDDLNSRLNQINAELEALFKVVTLLGIDIPARDTPVIASLTRTGTASAKGRTPGAISHKWREVLKALYSHASPFDYDRVKEVADQHGLDLVLTSIRDRVRKFIEAGYIKVVDGGKFIVAENAAVRFNFGKHIPDSEPVSTDNDGGLFGLKPSDPSSH